jgi:hypothetical protein
MNTRRDLMAGLGAAALGGIVVRPTAWPNVTLYTHEGQALRHPLSCQITPRMPGNRT